MAFEGIMLSEVSQTEKIVPHDSTYMWNQTKTEIIDTENRLVLA